MDILPNCGNCRYQYYDPNDADELEKCSIVGRYKEFSVNKEVEELIDKLALTSVCEYWRERTKIKQ